MGVDPINSVTSSATCSARAATSRVKRVIGQLTSVAATCRTQPERSSIGGRLGPFRGTRPGRVRPLTIGIVAGLGANDQLVVAFSLCIDVNRAESPLAYGLGGVITNRVLLTNV